MKVEVAEVTTISVFSARFIAELAFGLFLSFFLNAYSCGVMMMVV